MSQESFPKSTNLYSRRQNEFRRLHAKVNPLFTPKHALTLMLLSFKLLSQGRQPVES